MVSPGQNLAVGLLSVSFPLGEVQKPLHPADPHFCLALLQPESRVSWADPSSLPSPAAWLCPPRTAPLLAPVPCPRPSWFAAAGVRAPLRLTER